MNNFLASQCNNADDYTALRALYLSTDGDNWTDNTGWPDAATFMANPTIPSGTDMCDWYGISQNRAIIIGGGASTTTNEVNYVEVGDNNLNGSLPTEIGMITSLSGLRLEDNSITGSISALSTLSMLRTLDLTRTNVDGDISSLSSFQINIISLAETNVSGNISSLESMRSLETVDLEETNVGGNIAVFNGMPTLLVISLNNTNVTGDISSLQNTHSLLEIRLNNTGVSGDVSNIIFSESVYRMQFQNLNLSGCWSSYFKSRCSKLWDSNFDGNQGVISNQGFMELCGIGAGQCATNCPELISRTCLSRAGCSLVGGTYQAVDSVSYSGRYRISPGVAVVLNGGESVNLSNGFNVQHGGILQIDSDGCMQN